MVQKRQIRNRRKRKTEDKLGIGERGNDGGKV